MIRLPLRLAAIVRKRRWPYGVLLHADHVPHVRLEPRGVGGVVYFSEPHGRKTQAEYIAEVQGFLAVAQLRGGRVFDPYNDPDADCIRREVIPAKVRAEMIAWSTEGEVESRRVPYQYAYDIVQAAKPHGYTVFHFYEDSVGDDSVAVADASIIELLAWYSVQRNGAGRLLSFGVRR